MKHHELEIISKKDRKRVGRGISAGGGKTAGRGTKGQSARSGGKVKSSFEGGQIPLAQRIPKQKGFQPRPNGRITIKTSDLNKITGTTVDTKSLVQANVIDSEYRWVKLIKSGDIDKKYTVKLAAISSGALKAIEANGGSFSQTAKLERTSSKGKEKKD